MRGYIDLGIDGKSLLAGYSHDFAGCEKKTRRGE